jgi:hypothetical protein
LREQFKLGGDTIETDLEDSLGERKEWINTLTQQPINEADKAKIIKEGTDAADALKGANAKLIKLISSLEATP